MTQANEDIPHKKIAAKCFNEVWNYLDKTDRTPEQNETMIHLCHTSFWHWTQVPDHTATNLSIGYWQLSRVYAVVGLASISYQYGLRCLAVSNGLAPFYVGYAYEAIARSLIGMERYDEANEYLASAKEELTKVIDSNSQAYLKTDLDQLESLLRR